MEDGDNARQSQIVGSDGNLRLDADNGNAIADTNIAFRTDGSERLRITSGGSVLVGKTATSITTDGIRMDSNAAMITASSTSTNQATANGGSLSVSYTHLRAHET